MANRIQDLIDRAAAGEAIPGLTLWMQETGEESDREPTELPLHWRYRHPDIGPEQPGAVWPADLSPEESGALYVRGWSGPTDGAEDDTYSVATYFTGPDGLYVGPDQHGVYPCLIAE